MDTATDSHDSGPTDTPLIEGTMGERFDATVATWPDQDALVEMASGRRWTWHRLGLEVDDVARGLMAMGVDVGDRVGIWSPNSAEWTIAQLATAKIGAVLDTVNPAYRTHELKYVVNLSGMRVLLSANSFRSSNHRAMIAEVAADCPGLERVIYLDDSDWAGLVDAGTTVPADALAARMVTLAAADPINIQFTSGTTGRPKGATLSHRSILNNGYFVAEAIALTSDDRLVVPVPFYHCFGMVMATLGCVTHGATMIIPSAGFDAGFTLEAIDREQATAVYGVPTMFIAMLDHPDFESFDLSRLRTGIMAGSPCPVEVMKRCISRMHMSQVSIAYGMAETSLVSCPTGLDDDLDRRTTTIGRAAPHVQVKIVDPVTGEVVPRGMPGDFCARGDSVMVMTVMGKVRKVQMREDSVTALGLSEVNR